MLPLASGGLARVLLAVGERGERVALKIAHPHFSGEPEIRAQFSSEARALRTVAHPNVVELRGTLDEPLALALGYVHGVTLAYLLDVAARGGGALPIGVAARVLADVARGLDAVHAAGLAHGDVNPRNVVVAATGDAVLVDFGLAGDEGFRSPEGFRGTAAYAAPEAVVSGVTSARADVFALAVMAWEALRGERLFRGAGEADTMRRVVELAAPSLDTRREDLAPFAAPIAEGLEKEPSSRATSASGVVGVLAESAAGRDDVGAWVRRAAEAELSRREAALAQGFVQGASDGDADR